MRSEKGKTGMRGSLKIEAAIHTKKGEMKEILSDHYEIVEAYDALINERCYKAAFSKKEAFYMIINGECGVFSPKLMEAFRAVRR